MLFHQIVNLQKVNLILEQLKRGCVLKMTLDGMNNKLIFSNRIKMIIL